MEPFSIVKHFDVSKQHLLSLLSRGRNAIAKVVKALGLERGPRPEILWLASSPSY